MTHNPLRRIEEGQSLETKSAFEGEVAFDSNAFLD